MNTCKDCTVPPGIRLGKPEITLCPLHASTTALIEVLDEALIALENGCETDGDRVGLIRVISDTLEEARK